MANSLAEDIRICVTVHNRGDEGAEIHVLPHLWFRNTWAWGNGNHKPELVVEGEGEAVVALSGELGSYRLYREGGAPWLFTENDTDARRLFGVDGDGFFKDAFHEFVVNRREAAINSLRLGTKAAAHYRLDIPVAGRQSSGFG